MDGSVTGTIVSTIVGVVAVALVVGVAIPLATGDGRGGRRSRGSAVGSGIIGGMDEVFHPAADTARQIWEAETRIPAPAPLPGDPLKRSGGAREGEAR